MWRSELPFWIKKKSRLLYLCDFYFDWKIAQTETSDSVIKKKKMGAPQWVVWSSAIKRPWLGTPQILPTKLSWTNILLLVISASLRKKKRKEMAKEVILTSVGCPSLQSKRILHRDPWFVSWIMLSRRCVAASPRTCLNHLCSPQTLYKKGLERLRLRQAILDVKTTRWGPWSMYLRVSVKNACPRAFSSP